MRAILLVAVVLSATARAEEPRGLEEVCSRIRSGDLRTAAWAAKEAADRGLAGAVEAIVERLRGDDPDGVMRATLLDALVRLDVPLDPASVPTCVRSNAFEVLMLRHPARYESTLVADFRGSNDQWCDWLALGNALAPRRTAGFAAAVLGGIGIEHEVRVWNRVGRFRPPGGSVPC